MSKKLLIIDDNQDDLDNMKSHFNMAGYDEIFLAKTGEQGIDSAKKNKPDIVILDTRLPGIDGFETCKRIKAIKTLEAKVIVMTGLIDAVDVGKAREVGADDYVAKGPSCADLIESVQQFFKLE